MRSLALVGFLDREHFAQSFGMLKQRAIALVSLLIVTVVVGCLSSDQGAIDKAVSAVSPQLKPADLSNIPGPKTVPLLLMANISGPKCVPFLLTSDRVVGRAAIGARTRDQNSY